MRMASLPPIRSAAASHRGGEEEQSRADFEMGRFGGFEVDVEADFIFIEMEADDSTPAGEPSICAKW